MRKSTFFLLLFSTLAMLSISHMAINSSSIPPAAHTGAPGESTCTACHSPSGGLTGNVTLTFLPSVPTQYVPGTTYNVAVTVNASAPKLGFQVTALTANGQMAGSFTAGTNSATQNANVGGNTRQYVNHQNASGINAWAFTWTAPASAVGPVTFYVVGNAANNDGSSAFDNIYTTTFTLQGPASAPTAAFSINNNNPCPNESITFTNTSSGNITSYSWNFGAGATPATASTAGPHNVTYATSGSKTVSLTVQGPGGNNSTQQTVQVKNIPNASAGSAASVCKGDSVQLNASGGASYSWSNPATLTNPNIANPFAFPNNSTNYTVTVTGSNGCTATASVQVTVVNPPSPVITGDNSVCLGGTATLTASGGVSYLWSTGSTSATITGSPVTTSTYSVTVTDANGCSAVTQQTVVVNQLTTVSGGGNKTICAGDTVTLTGSGAVSYRWSIGGGSWTSIATISDVPATTTNYILEGTDGNGCKGFDTVVVTVNPLPTIPVISQTGPQLQSTATAGNQWFFDGNLVPGANGETFLPDANGTVYVEVTDPVTGCSSRSEDFNYVWGFAGKNLVPTWQVYPNPTSGLLQISGLQPGIVQTVVYDLAGKEVFRSADSVSGGFITISTDELKAGVYLLSVQQAGNAQFTRIVVSR